MDQSQEQSGYFVNPLKCPTSNQLKYKLVILNYIDGVIKFMVLLDFLLL